MSPTTHTHVHVLILYTYSHMHYAHTYRCVRTTIITWAPCIRPPVAAAAASTGSYQCVLYLKPVCPHEANKISPRILTVAQCTCLCALRNVLDDRGFLCFSWKSWNQAVFLGGGGAGCSFSEWCLHKGPGHRPKGVPFMRAENRPDVRASSRRHVRAMVQQVSVPPARGGRWPSHASYIM